MPSDRSRNSLTAAMRRDALLRAQPSWGRGVASAPGRTVAGSLLLYRYCSPTKLVAWILYPPLHHITSACMGASSLYDSDRIITCKSRRPPLVVTQENTGGRHQAHCRRTTMAQTGRLRGASCAPGFVLRGDARRCQGALRARLTRSGEPGVYTQGTPHARVDWRGPTVLRGWQRGRWRRPREGSARRRLRRKEWAAARVACGRCGVRRGGMGPMGGRDGGGRRAGTMPRCAVGTADEGAGASPKGGPSLPVRRPARN